MTWVISIEAARPLTELHSLLTAVESECNSGIEVTGREITTSGRHLYLDARKSAAFELAATIRARYILRGESVSVAPETFPRALHSAGRIRFKRYDVFSVPLKPEGFGYVQFLGRVDEMQADAVRVLDLVTTAREADAEHCARRADRFPPVLTLLKVGVKSFGWQVVGNAPVQSSVLMFRQSNAACVSGHGKFHDWRLWTSATGWSDIGDLSEELRSIEFATTWSPFSIAERIVGARNMYDACL
jgi:hypothetical protein